MSLLSIVLMDFNPIKPDLGLIVWTTFIFALFWFLIGRTAFRPIANALKKREEDIQGALDEAKLAKEEMSNLKAANEKLLAEAREERSKMLKEAKETKNKMIADAKTNVVLGVHIVGPEASNLISEAALAIEMGATLEDIALTIHPHPTLGETMMEAAEATLGHAIHIVQKKR